MGNGAIGGAPKKEKSASVDLHLLKAKPDTGESAYFSE